MSIKSFIDANITIEQKEMLEAAAKAIKSGKNIPNHIEVKKILADLSRSASGKVFA
jgi:hypothetical protein